VREARFTFLAAAGAARSVLARAELTERWDQDSALPRMSHGELAAHLARAVTVVETYLTTPVRPDAGQPISAAAYYASMNAAAADLDSELNVGVRQRASDGARAGGAAVLRGFESALAQLRSHLAGEADDRVIEVYGNHVLLLDEYLLTRIVELTIHTDDLCVSLGRRTPELPGAELTIRVLVEVARRRHGELALLRALARRERDPDDALRVL